MTESTDGAPRYLLFIGNLSARVTESGLRAMLEHFGVVHDLRLVKDPLTGSPSGYAFAEMMQEEAAARAIRGLHGKSIEGQPLIARSLY